MIKKENADFEKNFSNKATELNRERFKEALEEAKKGAAGKMPLRLHPNYGISKEE